MANPGERLDIENKINQIGDRIVRGKSGEKSNVVYFSHFQKGLAVGASTLTTLGLASPITAVFTGKGNATVNDVFDSWYGLPKFLSTFGIIVSVVALVAVVVFRQINVEEKAAQLSGLADGFKQLETQLKQYLEMDQPLQQLNTIYERAVALETSFFLIMPTTASEADIKAFSHSFIQKYSIYWGPQPSSLDRREK